MFLKCFLRFVRNSRGCMLIFKKQVSYVKNFSWAVSFLNFPGILAGSKVFLLDVFLIKRPVVYINIDKVGTY